MPEDSFQLQYRSGGDGAVMVLATVTVETTMVGLLETVDMDLDHLHLPMTTSASATSKETLIRYFGVVPVSFFSPSTEELLLMVP